MKEESEKCWRSGERSDVRGETSEEVSLIFRDSRLKRQQRQRLKKPSGDEAGVGLGVRVKAGSLEGGVWVRRRSLRSENDLGVQRGVWGPSPRLRSEFGIRDRIGGRGQVCCQWKGLWAEQRV